MKSSMHFSRDPRWTSYVALKSQRVLKNAKQPFSM